MGKVYVAEERREMRGIREFFQNRSFSCPDRTKKSREIEEKKSVRAFWRSDYADFREDTCEREGN